MNFVFMDKMARCKYFPHLAFIAKIKYKYCKANCFYE